MNPYRAIVHRDMKPVKPGRTLAGRLRSAWRRWLVWRGGMWRDRWERCGQCGRHGRIGTRLYLAGMCSMCWANGMPPKAAPTAPLVLPTIPDLVIPVRVPDGRTEVRRM